MNKKLRDRYIATLILHAVGDTIGFRNGIWEIEYKIKITTIIPAMGLELLYDFISLGGINGIDLKTWNISDDTLFHIAIAQMLLYYNKKNKKNEDIIKYTKTLFTNVYKNIMSDEKKGIARYIGITTKRAIEKFTQTYDERNAPYNSLSGGNGAAMRTPVIGLAFHGEKNRNELIYLSIETSKLTHNSPIGYLGGLVAALFTAYAIEGIHIYEWPKKMMDLLESNDVKKYINKKNNPNEESDYDEFIIYWKKYYELRFDNGKPIETRAHKNLVLRANYYFANFTEGTRGKIIGDSGYSATIMAYDCLIDANNKWEKLIIYAALHVGDTDTVASIAGAWFGALYGFADVPSNNYNYLELRNNIYNIADKIYKKFA